MKPIYIIFTGHIAGHDDEDRASPLRARNMIDAMSEAADRCRNDSNLYIVNLYEKCGKNEYRRVMKSADGISFKPAMSVVNVVRKSAGWGVSKRTWYEIVKGGTTK